MTLPDVLCPAALQFVQGTFDRRFGEKRPMDVVRAERSDPANQHLVADLLPLED
jgi:hypothetical protein